MIDTRAAGLHAIGLRKHYQSREVVSDVSLEVSPGRITGLFGPNGAGKSTCFRMVVGVLQPDAGRVWLDGVDVTHEPLFRRARRGLAYLPQEASAFRGLTVEDNIALVLEIAGRPRAAIHRQIDILLKEIGLESVRHEVARTLSGGERRRVEIARVLALNPRTLVLDEPFTGLDRQGIAELKVRFRRMADRGTGILLTDHNLHESLEICDHAWWMEDGSATPLDIGAPGGMRSEEGRVEGTRPMPGAARSRVAST